LAPLGIGLVAVALVTSGTRPATARSARLWSERPAGAKALAQVPDFRAVAGALIPSVVSIQVAQRVVASRSRRSPQDPFDFFHRYFGGELPREFHNRGLGTGFVIAADGLILTNNHVVENADAIEVSFADGQGGPRRR
jgi:serine protease Do